MATIQEAVEWAKRAPMAGPAMKTEIRRVVSHSVEATDWERIVLLYDEALGRLAPSPVVELNRAVALPMARGPAAGLQWSTA